MGVPPAPKVDKHVAEHIVGATVLEVGVAVIGDGEIAPYVKFSNGVMAVVACDSEFNGPGALHLEKNDKPLGIITVW
jgi:hypothetical protein